MTDRVMRPRLLLAGNHTCGNRGDSAILRGLIDGIEALAPDIDLTITSRFATSSSYLLGRKVRPDALYDWPSHDRTRPYRLKKWLIDRTPAMLARAIENGGKLPALLPAEVRRRISLLRDYAAVIQVGGSFFVDLYGERQYETPFCALLARRPLYLIGHSLGPFETRASKAMARTLLTHASRVILREPVSLELIDRDGLPQLRVDMGADTAWLVRGQPDTRSMADQLHGLTQGRPAIAVTLRDLAPFDRRLLVSQAAYEEAFAAMCSQCIDAGYDIVAASMCTGIEGYRDDRMPALRVAERVGRPERFHVFMDELNDLDLGHLFAACTILVGTRLHSAIIALNFGTPAIALNYEHKSLGIMRSLGIPECSSDLRDLLDGSLVPRVLDLARDNVAARARMAPKIQAQREIAMGSIRAVLADIELGASGSEHPLSPWSAAL